MKAQFMIEWLKQPSTIKAIIVLAGVAGYRLDPGRVNDVLLAVGTLYGLVGAFYDNQPRQPAPPQTPEETPLTEEGLKRLLAESKAKKNAAAP
jgi:hypothetical protein